MRAIIDYILKNKEWIFSGIGVLIISGLLLLIRYTFRRLPSRSYFVKRNENRKIFVGGILREIKEERQHFERIKKGKHLNLTGTTRTAVLKYSFDDIKGMVRRLEDERQYKKLVIPILQLINDRDMDNPVEAVIKLEPLLDELEKKLEEEKKSSILVTALRPNKSFNRSAD